MKTLPIAVLAAVFAASPVRAQQLPSFDQSLPTAPMLENRPKLSLAGIEITQECKPFDFAVGAPEASEEKRLESRTIEETCQPMPPAGCVPQRRVLWTDVIYAAIKVPGRDTTSAEQFGVCLQGRQLRVRVIKSPYQYEKPRFDEAGGKVAITLKRKG